MRARRRAIRTRGRRGWRAANSIHADDLGDERCARTAAACAAWRARAAEVRRARLSFRRRVMSTSSGFSGSAAVTVRGSRAMPHLGQAPGLSRTTSGCMGQTYSTRDVGAAMVSGSRAIPQMRQRPGLALADLGIHGTDVGVLGGWSGVFGRRRQRLRCGLDSA